MVMQDCYSQSESSFHVATLREGINGIKGTWVLTVLLCMLWEAELTRVLSVLENWERRDFVSVQNGLDAKATERQ